MPHVVLRTSLEISEIQRHFTPWYVSAADVDIKFISLYASALHGDLLVEAYIGEEPLPQRLGLSIRQRAAGDLVVGLHEIGFPRPTTGVHEAVRALAAWLQTLHPDTELRSSTLVSPAGEGSVVDE